MKGKQADAAEKVPAGQGCGGIEGEGQKLPFGHNAQEPNASREYEPIGHWMGFVLQRSRRKITSTSRWHIGTLQDS